MNLLCKTKNNYIGDEDSVIKLSKADNARVLVLSDSHGDTNILLKIINRYSSSCDAIVLCGDCIPDLQEIIRFAERDDEFCEKLAPVIVFVAGNCDSYSEDEDSFELYLSNSGDVSVPDFQSLKIGRHNFYICHGHGVGVSLGIGSLGLRAKLMGADVALYGHTHIASIDNDDDLIAINPGSCSKPRGGQKPCFAIVTVQGKSVDTAFIQIENKDSMEPDFKVENPIF